MEKVNPKYDGAKQEGQKRKLRFARIPSYRKDSMVYEVSSQYGNDQLKNLQKENRCIYVVVGIQIQCKIRKQKQEEVRWKLIWKECIWILRKIKIGRYLQKQLEIEEINEVQEVDKTENKGGINYDILMITVASHSNSVPAFSKCS